MQVTTKAIVLTSLKYGDTSLIVKAFTASDGIKSYLLKGILSSRKGKLKTAQFQPLTQLEIVAIHRNKGTLESIREAKLSYQYRSVQQDVAKSAVAMFLAEMLNNSVHEEEANLPLFEYLEAALQWLDHNERTANFHIQFLLGLCRYLGFYPDMTDDRFEYFDLQEGEFVQRPSLNPMVSGPQLIHFKRFLGMDFDAIDTIKLTPLERKELLQKLILYFELHLQGFRKPRSLAVLNEVFG